MDQRDEFAMQALPHFLNEQATEKNERLVDFHPLEPVDMRKAAKQAYQMADIMMQQRQVTNP